MTSEKSLRRTRATAWPPANSGRFRRPVGLRPAILQRGGPQKSTAATYPPLYMRLVS